MGEDPFAAALASETQLRELYDAPMERALRKQLDRLDEVARRLIAVAPLALVASHDAEGRCDVTPRGGQPGFVTVLDDDHLAIPDATGNNRLDTLQNVVATGHAGVIGRLTPVGKPPRSAIVVRADEVYAHCPKAFVRSGLWDPESWPPAADQPSAAEVSHAHLRRTDPALTLAEVERQQAEALKYRLA